jgi:hypothetical protein
MFGTTNHSDKKRKEEKKSNFFQKCIPCQHFYPNVDIQQHQQQHGLLKIFLGPRQPNTEELEKHFFRTLSLFKQRKTLFTIIIKQF